MILTKGIKYEDTIYGIGTRDNKKFFVDIIDEQFEEYYNTFIELADENEEFEEKGNYSEYILQKDVYLIEVNIIQNGEKTTIQILEKAPSIEQAYILSQNEELPSGYEENSWDTQKIYNAYGEELIIPICD